jgi:hypothetical protein
MAASIKGKADKALDDIQNEFKETDNAAKQMSNQVSQGAIEFERMNESARKADGIYNKIKEFVGAAGAVRTFWQSTYGRLHFYHLFLHVHIRSD